MSIYRDDILAGKHAVITGGGSGINFTIAETFARYGARVTLIGRTPEKLDNAAAEIKAAGGEAMGAPADVRDYAGLEAAIGKGVAAYGAIDLLVAGAAGNFPAPVVAMSANGFRAVVDIDLNGTFNTCRAAFEHLTKPGASIIAISAPQATVPTAMQSHVCAAKAGVAMFIQSLAVEWGPMGIRANCISPGAVDDTEGMRRLTPDEKTKAAAEKVIPIGRYARRDEIADLAVYLASPASAYATGATFTIDGGWQLVGSGVFAQAMMG